MNNNTAPMGASSPDASAPGGETANEDRASPPPQQFFIQEEGGLERWFNLTITNVGLEAVADYTCVAVNAGGVMEENISLTFEEPEPVRKICPRLRDCGKMLLWLKARLIL